MIDSPDPGGVPDAAHTGPSRDTIQAGVDKREFTECTIFETF